MTLVELKNIGLKIGGKQIIEGISLQLKRGKITTLIGPNGGGKTSLARILLGIIQPTSGKVLRLQQMKVGYMPQKIEIEKTIPISARDFVQLENGEIDQKLARRLNVEKILDKQIHDLSGGQLQKILFLRSLAGKPDLLVLDEPTQYMDIAAIQDFYLILEEVRKANGCTILLISHDLHLVMQKTDFVFCVNHHICCHGAPEDVNQHPEYLSLFGVYQHHHNHKH
ncbi:MAG: metal ABC transporter ATP-binding protein [Proteobacteria bacterium]|nr:metal ABC transporter ATP-binding protein [Pseudomonadota bacterium]